jgi:hypothetical protein
MSIPQYRKLQDGFCCTEMQNITNPHRTANPRHSVSKSSPVPLRDSTSSIQTQHSVFTVNSYTFRTEQFTIGLIQDLMTSKCNGIAILTILVFNNLSNLAKYSF